MSVDDVVADEQAEFPSRDSLTARSCISRTFSAPTRFSRLPMAPLLIASVESPAMVGPVTACPQAVMVSCPSFSVKRHAADQTFDAAH